ncbi:MAG: hypothetical protein LBL80_05125 [Ruminococcus sp.]|jgi:hypothetical protein|nr:hypothetical protein [Ruminococcus sp.]
MKKEDLIKKAAERGITLDETQAEKYINLSDEELENIASGGSGPCGFKQKVDPKKAINCIYYVLCNDGTVRTCYNCAHADSERDDWAGSSFTLYCTNEAAWK